MKINRLLLTSLAAATGLLSSGVIFAASVSGGNMGVKITIASACVVSATTPELNFGSVNSTDTSASANNGAGISVQCSNTLPYNIGLQSTRAGSTTGGAGTMSGSGSETIGYQLYQDASTTIAWGNDTSASPNTKAANGTGAVQTHVVYAKTTSPLEVPVGTYTDTVAVSVTY